MTLSSLKFRNLLSGAGLDVHEYSGRYMFGVTCVSVHCDREADVPIAIAQALVDGYIDRDETDALIAAVRGSRSESLGKGTVVYFPEVPWVDTRDEKPQGQ